MAGIIADGACGGQHAPTPGPHQSTLRRMCHFYSAGLVWLHGTENHLGHESTWAVYAVPHN